VVNEAAASGIPLLVSAHAGCAPALVPEPDGTTGSRFDPLDIDGLTIKLAWMAALPEESRRAMGRRAAEIVSHWGPDRFVQGLLEAIEIARAASRRRARTPAATVKAS